MKVSDVRIGSWVCGNGWRSQPQAGDRCYSANCLFGWDFGAVRSI
jgi:hypothetical protein